ncbi:MAG: hypothetical protein ABSD78_14575, partial [Acidimicrobiales bacterium]
FVVATIRSISRGWVSMGDGAAVTVRSWDVLSSRTPLVGSHSSFGTYDLGPLEYWLLTLPVHLDPSHGTLWGAALCCILAASLTIEATRSAFGLLGALAASLVVLGCVAWMPSIALGPTWNPHFGDLWFLSVLASSCAVLCGRRRWWPVLVLSGSVAAQTHLMFAATSVAVVLLGLGVEMARSHRTKSGFGWLAGGVVLGVACWAAPLVQEFTGRPGNLSVLLNHDTGHSVEGLAFGLRVLSSATMPPPLWWTASDGRNTHSIVSTIGARSPIFGVIALAVLVGLAVLAWSSRNRQIFAVSTVAALACVGLVVTFAVVPTDLFPPYLITVLLPVGALVWMTICCGFVVLGRRAIDKVTVARAGRPEVLGVANLSNAGITLLALLPLVAVAGLALRGQAEEFQRAFNWRLMPVVKTASLEIERAAGHQPVQIVVIGLHGTNTYGVMTGIAAKLDEDGYRPEVIGFESAAALGPSYLPRRGSAIARVTFHEYQVAVVVHLPEERRSPSPPVVR